MFWDNVVGHAFGYYNYGSQHGLIDVLPSRDAVAAFICGYVRMAFKSGILYTTGENGEKFITYKRPGKKVGIKAGFKLAKALLGKMKLVAKWNVQINHTPTGCFSRKHREEVFRSRSVRGVSHFRIA